ncbi:LysR substrate-binding domain-containing protein [Lewinella sp. LCG006]|uniref:hydrogen peroxide-inducible genes activator n=1 Tax=Lewinella sp. LCG006 TaxID=3231911 RepID=UPI00345F460D
MTLQQLEYAFFLLKTGSFSKAAKRAGLSQPAISQQITKLENELGFAVFDRQTKPIKTTPLGLRFLERAQMLLLEAQQLREFALQLEEDAEGSLTIGIIPTLAPYLVPFFIQDLQQKHPRIKLNVQEMMTKEIVRGILDGELNGGIISTPIASQLEFEYVPLFFEKFFLYISYKHPLFQQKEVNLDQIKMEDLWLLNEGNCFSDQVNNMCQLNYLNKQKPQLEYGSNSIEALRRIVEHKGGLTFLPELATLNVSSSHEDMIKKIAGPVRAREISMIFLNNNPKKQLLLKLKDVIQDNLPKSVLQKGEKLLVKTNVEV